MIKKFLVILFSAICSMPLSAQEKKPTTGVEYNSFRIVWEKNIFNPNRLSRASREIVKDPTPVKEADTISLTGSLLYEKESYAFFSGNRPEYQAAVIQGASIAEYRVALIQTDSVKLENNQESINLPVGMGLKKTEAGKWEVTTVFRPAAQSVSSNFSAIENRTDAGPGLGDSAPKSESAGASDILKKLMEKRAKELKK